MDTSQICFHRKVWEWKKKTLKARLVARGFIKESKLKYTDSPTCNRESLHVVLSIIASKDWKCNGIDTKAAFMQRRKIDCDIFLELLD